MKKETDLSSLESGVDLSIKEYSNIPLPDDLTKLQAIQLISKEIKLLSDERKRLSDEQMQEKRFELEKDKVYSSQQLDKDKLAAEKDKNQKDYDLAIRKIDIEITKMQIERDRLLLDTRIFESNEEHRKRDRIFNLIADISKVAIPAIITGIGTLIYIRFMKQCMSITMIDNGLVSKPVSDVINRFDKIAKI